MSAGHSPAPDGSSEQRAARRVILLGASNLTLSFPLVVNTLRHSLTGPVDLFAAHGHGRSYCQWSYVLHRGLPSILESGLWTELSSHSQDSVAWGLITDIGNDLLYGRRPKEIQTQVREAMQRLMQAGAGITFVRPPIERILQLSDWRYRCTKRMLFPGPVTPWKDMSRMIVELDAAVTEMAATFQAEIVTPATRWYGIDPIHVRRRWRRSAWETVLKTWPFSEPVVMSPATARRAWTIWRCAPQQRTWRRRLSEQAQPVWQFGDDFRLWLY